ncbi:DUF2291 domain-containing protein [bacterium]|nr:DUF2291 domain-containing protein [bacterium]
MSKTGTRSGGAAAAVSRPRRRSWVVGLAIVALLLAIGLDTKVVRVGGDEDQRQQAFDPDAFGQREFPRIRDYVLGRAVAAPQLAEELAADKNAAIEAYGTVAGAFPVLTVSLTGVVGEGKSGIYSVVVDGMPEGTGIRIQTGPAINGTELRDIVGDIEFGAFKNQIEYQNAGAGINRAMSAEVLTELDRTALAGKTVSVAGAFKMINPKNWLVTPVRLEIQ